MVWECESHGAARPQGQVEALLDVQMSAAVIAERDAFVQGFRLAVHLLLDGLADPRCLSF